MPRILVTNDDGIFSEGIKLLAQALRSFALAEGYVKPTSEDDKKTIDLEKYRAAKASSSRSGGNRE